MKESKKLNILQHSLAQIANSVPYNKKDLKENKMNLEETEKDVLLKMYNKSLEFQNCFENWKQTTLDCGSIDPLKIACEKSQKFQEAMRTNIIQKTQLMETFKNSLKSAKDEYSKLALEKKELERSLKTKSDEQNKGQQNLRIRVIKMEEWMKAENDRLGDIENEYEETKKAKLEILQAGNTVLQELDQELKNLCEEKQKIEEYLEKVHSENMEILQDTIKPLEETRKEIERQKLILQERMNVMKNLIKGTLEEQGMLVEDLNSHLFQRAEYVAQREELDFLHEQVLQGQTQESELFIKSKESKEMLEKYEKCKEQNYYIELVQQILETKNFPKSKITEEIQAEFKKFVENIKNSNLEAAKIPEILAILCKKLALRLDKESVVKKYICFSKSRDEINNKISQDILSVDEALKCVDNSIRNSVNFVDNNIVPHMSAVFF